jgi:hypothetical protein
LVCFKGKEHVQNQNTTFECLIKRSTAIADMLSLNKHRDLRNKACFITKHDAHRDLRNKACFITKHDVYQAMIILLVYMV